VELIKTLLGWVLALGVGFIASVLMTALAATILDIYKEQK
jgi:hypothetical protein